MGYVVKNATKNQVTVCARHSDEGKHAVTDYRTLACANRISLVECELITGRTHQIRAMLAHAGHPLVGDPKYGNPRVNRESGLKFQALWSYRLTFAFTTPAGALEYLNGKSFQVEQVPFAEKFFPGSLKRNEKNY